MPVALLVVSVLPLFFLPPDDPNLPRSAWQPLRDRAVFLTPGDGEPVAWAVRQITQFIQREVERGLDNDLWLRADSASRTRLGERHGLIERITTLHPSAVPPPSAP